MLISMCILFVKELSPIFRLKIFYCLLPFKNGFLLNSRKIIMFYVKFIETSIWAALYQRIIKLLRYLRNTMFFSCKYLNKTVKKRQQSPFQFSVTFLSTLFKVLFMKPKPWEQLQNLGSTPKTIKAIPKPRERHPSLLRMTSKHNSMIVLIEDDILTKCSSPLHEVENEDDISH